MAIDETQQRILQLLDVLSVEVGATRAGVARLETRVESLTDRVESLTDRVDGLAKDTDAGFQRVERRLGNPETRTDGIGTESRTFRRETDNRISALEARQG